ncbi:MAG: four helix bundle protein [Ignavibacteriales bacterium]|nr:four helix bundle protein [Ignavibacteriales bacterium]
MKANNAILEKSYKFSLRIIKLHQYLIKNKTAYIIANQVLRCGTSIGANCEEGNSGQSRKDFIAKLFISFKEAKETHYWLRLLRDSEMLDAKLSESLITDCDELIKLLTSILKTTRNNSPT